MQDADLWCYVKIFKMQNFYQAPLNLGIKFLLLALPYLQSPITRQQIQKCSWLLIYFICTLSVSSPCVYWTTVFNSNIDQLESVNTCSRVGTACNNCPSPPRRPCLHYMMILILNPGLEGNAVKSIYLLSPWHNQHLINK